MKIKDELFLQGMTQAAADEIGYNTMGGFQTSNCNTHGYYIGKWTGNANTIQEKYKCHAFNPPVIIPEGGLFCPSKFMTLILKNLPLVSRDKRSNPCHGEVKQVFMPFLELIQENNTTNKLSLRTLCA